MQAPRSRNARRSAADWPHAAHPGYPSELHPIGALEAEHLARLLRAGGFVAELGDDAADLGHLLGIAGRELAGTDIEAVLQTDSDVAAQHGGDGAEVHLVAAAGEHRPQIVVAEQTVGGALHEQKVVDIGPDATENAEDELKEDRRLEQATVDAMGEVVEVASVVAFVLELHPVALAQRAIDLLDVAERVGKDVGVRLREVWLLPVVLPGLVALRHGIE